MPAIVDSYTGLPNSSIPSNPFSAPVLHPTAPLVTNTTTTFSFYHYRETADDTAFLSINQSCGSQEQVWKKILSLPTLSFVIQLSHFTSLKRVLCNDALPQQPFLQPDASFTSNSPHLQWFPCCITSTSKSSPEQRSSLLSSRRKFLSKQNSTID